MLRVGGSVRTPARRGAVARRALGAALLAAVTLTGCGVRLETPPPEVPVADAAEEVRQQAARAASELHAAARSARTAADEPEVVEVLVAVETAAARHHAALGGLWEPWPGAGPDATASPGPDATPTPTPADSTPGDVLDLLEESAAAARDGAIDQAGELGRLLGSVAISRTHLAADLGGALGVDVQTLPAAPLPAPEPGSVDPGTSRAVDAARYAFEVVAARSDGGQRDAAVARAAQLAAVAGAVAPEEDEREVAYDVSGADTTRDLAGAAELDVVAAYLALLDGDRTDRAAVLDAATHAARQARSWDTALPVLPGLS